MLKLFFTFISLIVIIGRETFAREVVKIKSGEGSYREFLDADEKFLLGWSVTEEEIVFQAEVETKGFIGLGVSPQGKMDGADLFIAGVYANGSGYFYDMYGVGNTAVQDNHTDWELLEAEELFSTGNQRTFTYLKFSRKLNTCDSQDFEISHDTTKLIWSYGAADEVFLHSKRGQKSLNLLLPPPLTASEEQILKTNNKEWLVSINMTMPSEKTTYWCSFHKGLELTKKHHVIALEAYLPDKAAKTHTHHFIFYRCRQDKSTFALLQNKTVDKGELGGQCYHHLSKTFTEMHGSCSDYVYVWAVGGQKMLFPDNVGYPIGDALEKDPKIPYFYMLEVHYDNPNKIANVQIETGVKIIYTDNLREQDAGLLSVGYDVTSFVSLLIPPNTQDFVTVGHCSANCTEKEFPADGINVFNVLLHSHLSGRKLKLRHFRGETELPWIDVDNNYDFNFQHSKPRYAKVMPGDQMSLECTYDTRWKKGEVVIGGFSTREEMCQAFLWYYPKMDLDQCESHYDKRKGLESLGIDANRVYYTSFAGAPTWTYSVRGGSYPFQNYMSTMYKWTEEKIHKMQAERRFSDHKGYCTVRKSLKNGLHMYNRTFESVNYPKIIKEYKESDACEKRALTTNDITSFWGLLSSLF